MRPFRRILASTAARWFLTWLAAGYIRLVEATSRWRPLVGEAPRALLESGEPVIGCFWHGRLLMMPRAWPRHRPVAVLVSRHRDGEIIAETVARLGIAAVRGSSGKGGASAMRTMLKALERGVSIAITPDGPRGPRMRASTGVITLAQLSGRPILPCAYSAAQARVLKSWDRFLVPLPFTRGVHVWGTPVHVPRDADEGALEAARRRLEAELNALTEEADRLMGRAPVAPAEAGAQALQDARHRRAGLGR